MMKNKFGWEIKSLKQLGQIVTGNTPKTSNKDNYNSNDFCFFKPTDLRGETISLLDKSENFISKYAFDGSRILPVGSVLVTCIGTVGNVGVTTVESTSNQQINAIIPNNDINSMFLAYSISSLRSYLNHIANAPVVPIINKTQFSEVKISIPPLPIQHQIVSELDTLSDIITKKKQQLADLDKLAQATFYELFGDPVKNEKGWEVRKLGTLGVLGRGVSKNRPRNSPDLLGGVTPLIQTGEIANAGMYLTKYSQTYSQKGLEQSKLWAKNTLCITIAATIGKTSILTFDACFPDSIVGFTPNLDIIDVIFVYYFFSCIQKELEDNAPQVAQKNINLEILNKINTILPPLTLQSQFAERVQRIEKQKELINKSIDDVQQLFDYKMDSYFN